MQNTASKIIKKCGGHENVAKWLNVAPVTVYRWTYPKTKGGTGGRIPQDRIEVLIAAASERNIKLRISDFFAKPASAPTEAA